MTMTQYQSEERYRQTKRDLADAQAKALEITELAQSEGREMTGSETVRYNALVSEANDHTAFIEKCEARQPIKEFEPSAQERQRLQGNSMLPSTRGGVLNMSRYSLSQTIGAPQDTENGFGEFARGLTTGFDKHTPPSVRDAYNTQTGGTDTAGGYIVPQVLSSQIIDLARSMLVSDVFQWYQLSSDNMHIPQIVQDPVFATVAENSAISTTDIVFDEAVLLPKKLAAIIYCSNELMSDGIDTAGRIQNTMARALAVAMDTQLLVGDGTGTNVLGLMNDTSIPGTNIGGALSRTDVDAAVQAVRERNHEPTHCLLSPGNFHALSLEQASTSGTWLGPPPSSAGLEYRPTTILDDTQLVVGDFASGFAAGMREGMRLEITNSDSESWLKDLTSFRAVVRIDGVPIDANAMQRVTGIA